ncbi:MAG: allophanate hydrolase [Rhodoblastus sp.]
MKDLSFDLTSLRAAYESGLDPHALIDLVYDRIAAANDPGIFIALRPRDDLHAEIGKLGPRGGALWGVPFAVKDNIDVAGVPTTAACPDFVYTPVADAASVARLRAAGALAIGKTNLDQFATGLVGLRTPYPAPLNAFDPAIVPGGSSSGSAVAVARGLVSFALGTDTAGSGRVPAGLNNIVGLKPTVGAVSARGMVPACRTLDCVSVFALTTQDAWDVYAAMAAFDPQDSVSRGIGLAIPGEASGLRIGAPDAASRKFGGDGLAEAAFDAHLDALRALGATIVEVSLAPFFETARLLYEGPWVAERYAAMREFLARTPDSVLPVTRGIVEGATKFSAADAFDGLYRLADLRRATSGVWNDIDALVVPTFPRPRTVADVLADPLGPNAELGTYTNFVNLLDLCALAVPGRFRSDGFPASVTFIAPAGKDHVLAGLGARFHTAAGVALGATGAPNPATPFSENSMSDQIEIVVVGAHMSGLPLNRELTALGGRFSRVVETKPDYRFYALPGGPPFRPGLLRVAAGTGVAIAAEVWTLDAAGFGAFVSGIPAPLGIGTLLLSDGATPKGFLVEAEAVRGAEDISAYGGWRAFMAAKAA